MPCPALNKSMEEQKEGWQYFERPFERSSGRFLKVPLKVVLVVLRKLAGPPHRPFPGLLEILKSPLTSLQMAFSWLHQNHPGGLDEVYQDNHCLEACPKTALLDVQRICVCVPTRAQYKLVLVVFGSHNRYASP